MNIIEFKNEKEFAKYVESEARKIIKEGTVQSLGIPTDLKMNQKDGSKNSTGAQIDADGKTKKSNHT